MRMRSSTLRNGFTLLEVMLAALIAVLVMAGLYAAVDIQLTMMDKGRAAVEKSTVERALFNRIDVDFNSAVAPLVPASVLAPAAAGGGGGGGMGGATGGAGSTSSSSSSNSNSLSAGSTLSSTSNANGVPPVYFQFGVQGQNNYVTIFQTRLTRNVVNPPSAATSSQQPYGCDVRRITYFMPSNGGLARQEVLMPTVTSSAAAMPPTDLDSYSKVVASEVQSFQVSYYDGTNWNQSWDGSTLGADNVTPIGPPVAIQITITVQLPDSDTPVTYNHVISFNAAPGNPVNASSSSGTGTGSGSP